MPKSLHSRANNKHRRAPNRETLPLICLRRMYYNLLSLEEERKPNRMQNAVDYKTSVLVPGPWLQLHCTLRWPNTVLARAFADAN